MVIGIIPARLASTRFPNKPLAKMHGYSMIEHVYRRSKYAKSIDEIYITTCDGEIADEAKRFGAKVIMTSNTHTRGTDRVAEAANKVDADIVINIQGDEPLVDPYSLDEAIEYMQNDKIIKSINLVSRITNWDIFADPGVVKTVINEANKVLYFSRQPIPDVAKDNFEYGLKQIGIYLFRKEFLLEFSSWEETPLEKKEKVDMLRILERGFSVDSFEVKDMVSVDTPEDLKVAEKLISEDELFRKIFG